MTARPGSQLPYRPCVGMMLLNTQGLVFVGRRKPNEETADSPYAWQMPQGGIDDGETPEEAALRELHEEVGTDKAIILAETADWLTYDLPEELIGIALKGRYRGQIQKWFAMRFTGIDADIDIETEHPEFDDWKWVEMDNLPELIVPFKRPIYEAVIREFRALAAG